MEFSNWVWIIPTQEVRVAKQWNRCAWFWAVNSKQEIWRWTPIAITLGDWGWALNCAGYVLDIHWAQYYCQWGCWALEGPLPTTHPTVGHSVQMYRCARWWCSITQNNINELHCTVMSGDIVAGILASRRSFSVCARCPDVDRRKNSCLLLLEDF